MRTLSARWRQVSIPAWQRWPLTRGPPTRWKPRDGTIHLRNSDLIPNLHRIFLLELWYHPPQLLSSYFWWIEWIKVKLSSSTSSLEYPVLNHTSKLERFDAPTRIPSVLRSRTSCGKMPVGGDLVHVNFRCLYIIYQIHLKTVRQNNEAWCSWRNPLTYGWFSQRWTLFPCQQCPPLALEVVAAAAKGC